MSKYPSLYSWSLSEAVKYNERDLWRESYKLNCNCARSIEKAITQHHDGTHMNTDFMNDILEQYGFNRVNFVLANTIKYKDDDGRFSPDNRKWASQFYIPNDEVRWHFSVDSHPTLVDACISNVRKQWQAKGFFDKSHCESGENINYEGRVLVIKPTELVEEYQTPDFQLFCATSGFGCNPTASGRKVFGFFLKDEEDTHFDRSQFAGAIRDECLPDWAKEKLEQFSSDETEDINLGGMQQ